MIDSAVACTSQAPSQSADSRQRAEEFRRVVSQGLAVAAGRSRLLYASATGFILGTDVRTHVLQ